jgi:hypothetical protein
MEVEVMPTTYKDLLLIAAVVVVPIAVAFAGKLEDFKEADRYDEGCDTIPVTYGSERSSCKSEGPKVHEWCDGGSRGPVTCGNEEQTRAPKRDIEKFTRLISDLKDARSKADSNKSNAKSDDEKRKYEEEIKKIDRDLDQANKDLDLAKAALEARKKHVQAAIYTLDQCIAYRRAVMNSFAAALDKMRNERETPDIKTVAESLARKYERSKSGHEQQITAKQNALANCKSWDP